MGEQRRSGMAIPPEGISPQPTPEEQIALERVINASSARIDQVRRTRAVLAVSAGHSFA